MSIYPKRIARGDNVIIHTKFFNRSLICIPITVNLELENKLEKYKKQLLKNKIFFLPSLMDNEKDFIEKFFIFKTDERTPLGKYNCLLTINYFGKKIKSLTRKNDYFFIEKLNFSRKKGKIILINMTNFNIKIKLIYLKKKQNKMIKPHSKIVVTEKNFLYAVYANNDILL